MNFQSLTYLQRGSLYYLAHKLIFSITSFFLYNIDIFKFNLWLKKKKQVAKGSIRHTKFEAAMHNRMPRGRGWPMPETSKWKWFLVLGLTPIQLKANELDRV